MWIQVLGPMSVDVGSHAAAGRGSSGASLGGPKQRTVFALLALRANRTVGVEELIDEVWEDDPPGRPRKTLQVYIANLRRELGASTDAATSTGSREERIVTGAFGYQLRADDEELDVRRFEALLARARAQAVSAPRLAIAGYESALGLWSGDRPLADLLSSAAVARLVRPLEEARRDAVEELMALRIRHGGAAAAAAVAALPDLIAADPWRERLWGLLMEGYYATGRQVEALEAYQRVRNRMIDELGVEPGPELRELEGRILAQDPTLTPVPAATPVVVEPPTIDERRTSTFVSVGLADYERLLTVLDPEDLADLVDEVRARVADVVARHGGRVAPGGDDGVLASFGYPSAAEDDPQQAVRAALAACAAQPTGVAVCAGVHTGLALFRGSPPVATGQAPAIAVRLQRAARAGEVLASSHTAAVVSSGFSLSPTGRPVALPSEITSVVVAGELPSAGADLASASVTGRTVELSRLRTLDEAAEPAVVAVVGEAGIGKTALLAAFLAPNPRTAGPGRPASAAMVIRGDRHRRSQSLYPIGQVLSMRYADRDELELELDLLGVPQPGLADVSAVLGDLAGWPAVSDLPPVLSVAARRAAVTTWLAALATSQPLRLVVEDLPYLDEETTAAVDALVDEVNQGLVVVTSREEYLPPRIDARAHRIELGRLSADDARALVVGAAAPTRLRLATINQILRLADGHPLHLRELARQAATAGTGRRADVPATLNASLLARLDRLGPAKALVQRCAVIGDQFDVEMATLVCAGTELAGPELPRRLDDLVADGVLLRSGTVGRPQYGFVQALLEDVAYASLPRSVRTDLHQRIAARLSADPEPAGAQLAEHLEAAGQVAPAALGWVQAADAALRGTRFAEAQQYARRALADADGLPPGADSARLVMMAKLVLATAIKMTVISDDELVETVLSAFALVEQSGQLELRVRFYPLLISTLQAIGRYDDAVTRGTEAVALAQAAGNAISERRARQFHAATLIWMGRLSEAAAIYEPTDDAGAEDDDLSMLMRAAELLSDCAGLALAGLAETTRREAQRSDDLFARARLRATSASAPDAVCLVTATHGIALQLTGDAVGTQEAAEATLGLAVQLGNDWWFVWAQALLGWSVAASGNPSEGLAIVLEAIEQAGDVKQLLPYFHALAAYAELGAGLAADALVRLRDAAALAESTGERFFLPYVHLVTVEALIATGASEDEVSLHRGIAEDLARSQGQQLFVDQVASAH